MERVYETLVVSSVPDILRILYGGEPPQVVPGSQLRARDLELLEFVEKEGSRLREVLLSGGDDVEQVRFSHIRHRSFLTLGWALGRQHSRRFCAEMRSNAQGASSGPTGLQ